MNPNLSAINERDAHVRSVTLDLSELINRPSQHSAAYIRRIAERAQTTLDDLLRDLKGWEQEFSE